MAGVRLDKFLRRMFSTVPVSHLFKMVRTKKVRVNAKRAQADQPLALGDTVSVRGTEDRLMRPAAAPLNNAPNHKLPISLDLKKLEILFEDDWILALNKPSGMAAHAGSGIVDGTVVDYARAYLGTHATRNGFTASPAHRLDRETSGVILVAKRRPAMVHFTDVFTRGLSQKRYLTLVKGKMPRPRGEIDAPLSERQQTLASKDRRGVNMQTALTRYLVLKTTLACGLLECEIKTGRTHQIRRHLVSLGHPVAGDKKYGDFEFNREARTQWGLKRMFLHARRIEFPHPETQIKMVIEAQLPSELVQVLERAGLETQ